MEKQKGIASEMTISEMMLEFSFHNRIRRKKTMRVWPCKRMDTKMGIRSKL
jgi:hypothetical protein